MYIETEKDSPKAKDSWDNLGKAGGKKQAKIMLAYITKNESPCVIYLGAG